MQTDTYYSIGIVRKLTGLSTHKLRYLDSTGEFVAQRTAGGHRRYLRSDVELFIGRIRKTGIHDRRLAPEGFFSQKGAADAIGIPRSTFTLNLKMGRIARPSRLIGSRSFYSAKDVSKLKEWFALHVAVRTRYHVYTPAM